MIEFNILEKIDWDFTDSQTNTTTNSFHPYPAKYIPQIPGSFIKELTSEGDTVYDPFLGSGTTALEAILQGRNAIGNDVNELAVLLSKVKTTPIHSKQLIEIDSIVEKIYFQIENFYSKSNKEQLENLIPEIINLQSWFKDFVINELLIIKKEINSVQNINLRNFCLIAFSSIIVAVSYQDSDTRYVHVEKNIKHFDVYKKFKRQISKMTTAMNESYKYFLSGKGIYKTADTRTEGIFDENSADLVITSPPYPNAYDYHLYHKYRLLWLDMDPFKLKKLEIGSHAHYSKKNGLNEFDFQRDMEICFINISKILKKDKFFVIVIGDSILQGRNIANNEVLKLAAKNTPLIYETEFLRNINLRKKSFNPVIGNIKTEKILIFKNLK